VQAPDDASGVGASRSTGGLALYFGDTGACSLTAGASCASLFPAGDIAGPSDAGPVATQFRLEDSEGPPAGAGLGAGAILRVNKRRPGGAYNPLSPAAAEAASSPAVGGGENWGGSCAAAYACGGGGAAGGGGGGDEAERALESLRQRLGAEIQANIYRIYIYVIYMLDREN
jgi:hypothetical protein